MRLSETADFLSRYLNRDPDEVLMALRNPRVKMHLNGTAGPTPKSPADYDFAEQIRAFVLLASQAAGLLGTDLGAVNRALNARNAALQDEPRGPIPTALEALILSLADGRRDWHLVATIFQRRDGERETTVHLERGEMAIHGQRAANARWLTEGLLPVGHLCIPVGALLAPLFDAMDEG